MTTQQDVLIKSAVDAWDLHIKRMNSLLAALSDADLQQEVAPGKNTGVYLLGHRTAVNDALLPLLGGGENMYPALEPVFLRNPDKSGMEKPSVMDLRRYWEEVNARLTSHLKQYTVSDWLQKHGSISAADFEKEPHRNKLNVLTTRTTHLAYHLGQLVLLKK